MVSATECCSAVLTAALLSVPSVMQCLSMYKPADCGSYNAFYLIHKASSQRPLHRGQRSTMVRYALLTTAMLAAAM